MSTIEIVRARVVLPIRFTSLASKTVQRPPTMARPELDDRIPGMEEVGLTWDDGTGAHDIVVGVVRRVEATPLRVASRGGLLSFPDAPAGVLSGDELRIRATEGGAHGARHRDTSDWADIYWNDTLLASLKVFIYQRLHVQVRFHYCYCTRDDWTPQRFQEARRAGRIRPMDYMNVTAAFDVVNAIWNQAGVEFHARVGFHGANRVESLKGAEGVPLVANADFAADKFSFFDGMKTHVQSQRHANIYFVYKLGDIASWLRAVTFPCRPWEVAVANAPTASPSGGATPSGSTHTAVVPYYLQAPFPGIVVPCYQLNGTATWTTVEDLGCTLAHELGHLFGMRHPSDVPHGATTDIPAATWGASRRLMMHNLTECHYLIPHTSRYDPEVHRLVDSTGRSARRQIREFMDLTSPSP